MVFGSTIIEGQMPRPLALYLVSAFGSDRFCGPAPMRVMLLKVTLALSFIISAPVMPPKSSTEAFTLSEAAQRTNDCTQSQTLGMSI